VGGWEGGWEGERVPVGGREGRTAARARRWGGVPPRPPRQRPPRSASRRTPTGDTAPARPPALLLLLLPPARLPMQSPPPDLPPPPTSQRGRQHHSGGVPLRRRCYLISCGWTLSRRGTARVPCPMCTRCVPTRQRRLVYIYIYIYIYIYAYNTFISYIPVRCMHIVHTCIYYTSIWQRRLDGLVHACMRLSARRRPGFGSQRLRPDRRKSLSVPGPLCPALPSLSLLPSCME
jgi:hypothetical protein